MPILRLYLWPGCAASVRVVLRVTTMEPKPITTTDEWKKFKSDCHERRKVLGLGSSHMCELMAKERGYRTYAALRAASARQDPL